jgi:hypothetical protein
MDKICTVPKGFGKDDYEICGLPASYLVGSWYVCEGHKKYYCDPNRWPAEPLKGEGEDDQKTECEC